MKGTDKELKNKLLIQLIKNAQNKKTTPSSPVNPRNVALSKKIRA